MNALVHFPFLFSRNDRIVTVYVIPLTSLTIKLRGAREYVLPHDLHDRSQTLMSDAHSEGAKERMSGGATPEPASVEKAAPISNDGMETVEREYIDFTEGEETFYHPYTAPTRMENNIIEFDLQNLRKILVENREGIPVEKIAEAVRQHYLDSSRLIKRAFGRKIDDDFQLYNWGLTLAMDMGLATDKVELLLMVYSKKMPRRITLPDFEKFMKEHSTWRYIRRRTERERKWLDLMASFKIHQVKKEGYPDSIGKRQFQTILDVNEVDMDLNIVRLTKDMRRGDRYSNKLHMLLLDDPLIKGDFSAAKAKEINEAHPYDNERLRDFEARIQDEEDKYGEEIQEEVDARMKAQFEKQARLEEERCEKRKKRDEERAEVKRKEDEERAAKLARLEEIKNERLAHEKRKEEEKRKDEEEKRLAAMKAEQDEIIRQELEYADAEEAQSLRKLTDIARAEEEERLRKAEIEKHLAGKFDHLTGEERIRAEAAERLAENRRLKALERKRLLEETRRYAESRLALKNARDLGSRLAGGGFVEDVVGGKRAISAETSKRRKQGDVSKSMKASKVHKTTDITEEPEAGSISERALETLKKSGKRSSSAATDVRPTPSDAMDVETSDNQDTAAAVRPGSAAARRRAEHEAKREQLAMEELLRVEKSREKLRKIEEERIKGIESAEKVKQDKALQRIMSKKKQEEDRLAMEEEKARQKEERKKRMEESAALRKMEMEVLDGQKKDSKGARALRREESSLAKSESEKKARAMRQAKREEAMERAQAMKKDEEERRKNLQRVLDKKASSKVEPRLKTVKKAGKKATSRSSSSEGSAPVDVTSTDAAVSDAIDDSCDVVVAVGTDKMMLDDVKDLDALLPANMGATADEEAMELSVDEPDEPREAAEAAEETPPAESEVDHESLKRQDSVDQGDDYIFSEKGDVGEPIALVASEDDESLQAELALEAAAEAAKAEREAQEETERVARAISETLRREEEKVDDEKEKAHVEETARAHQEARRLSLADQAAREEQEAAETADSARTKDTATIPSELEAMEEEGWDTATMDIPAAATIAAASEEEVRATMDDTLGGPGRAELLAGEDTTQDIQDDASPGVDAEDEESPTDQEQEKMQEQARLEAQRREEEQAEAEAAREKLKLLEEEAAATAKEQEEAQQEEENRLRELELMEERAVDEAQRRQEVLRLEEELRQKREEEARLEREERERLQRVADERKRQIEEAKLEEQRLKEEEESAFWAEAAPDADETGSRRSSKPSIASLPAFQVHEHEDFVRPENAYSIEDIRRLASEEVDILVTKSTDGTLRVNVREDSDEDQHRGLFVHSFKKESVAEAEGYLQVHDEILAVNGIDVEGGDLGQLVTALKSDELGLTVSMRVRRQHADLGRIIYDGSVPDHSVVKPGEVLSPTRLADIGLPTLSKLHSLPAEVLEFEVPKSADGGLHIVFHTAEEDGYSHSALVLHSLEPDSAAARQDLLKQGDELLALDGFDLGRNLDGYDPNETINGILSLPDTLLRDTVHMRVRRHHGDLAELTTSAKIEPEEMLKTVPPFSILDGLATRHADFPSLDELASLPFHVIELEVPKSSDGTLRLNVRHDDEGDAHGLFIHGFKPNSAAEKQGILCIGDELLAVDGDIVEGKFLSALVPILQRHQGPSVNMRIRRHLLPGMDEDLFAAQAEEDALLSSRLSSPRPQITTARLEMSPRAPTTPMLTHRSEHEVYQIHDSVTKGLEEPNLQELMLFPAVDIELSVPKSSDGSLRLYIRHDDEGDAHGLFVHGFKPNSAAEKQGLIKAGDELVSVNKVNVKGGFLEDVISALKDHMGPNVQMMIRRHMMEESDELLKEMVAHEFESNRQALMDELMSADQTEKADNQARRAERKAQIEKLMQEQKRTRQEKLEREAEERAAKARSMPNSLLTEKARAVAEASMPYKDYKCSVPKTHGELKMHVKHSYKRGLFIHSFKANSLAEEQGVIEVGDEIIDVEGTNVHGAPLRTLVSILKGHKKDTVNMVLRRHKDNLFI